MEAKKKNLTIYLWAFFSLIITQLVANAGYTAADETAASFCYE